MVEGKPHPEDSDEAEAIQRSVRNHLTQAHTCTFAQGGMWEDGILQHYMRGNLETPEMPIHRSIPAMEYDTTLKRMRDVWA